MTGCYCVLHPTFSPTQNHQSDPANHPQPHSSRAAPPNSATWIGAKPKPEQSAKRDKRVKHTHSQNMSASREAVSVNMLHLSLAVRQDSLRRLFFLHHKSQSAVSPLPRFEVFYKDTAEAEHSSVKISQHFTDENLAEKSK